MAFKDFSDQQQSIQLLQRSLSRGRLAHAYLFTGHQIDGLEGLARTFAKALNCRRGIGAGAVATESCDDCPSCAKIDHSNHPDVHWVRPESKSRVITVEQMRNLMREIQLKPGEAEFKVAILVGADRLRVEAANAFLKTLEEPPAKSILILLSTEPQRLLDTILSRCLRLSFAGGSPHATDPASRPWLESFSQMAALEQKSLLGRYRLLDMLLRQLTEIKAGVEAALTARSPLQQYQDADKSYLEKWEDELAASIEAEYRRRRADILGLLHWWLRDVWLKTLSPHHAEGRPPRASANATHSRPESRSLDAGEELFAFPELGATERVARRISTQEALQNLQIVEQVQRWLGTNVQEALALEVGLLKLRL